MTTTIAKTSTWCLNCPSGIRPGDPVVIDPAYAKPGYGDRQPMVHERCDGLPPWDPDQEMGDRGVKAAFTPRGGIR